MTSFTLTVGWRNNEVAAAVNTQKASKVMFLKSLFIRVLTAGNMLENLTWHMMHLAADAVNYAAITGAALCGNPAPRQPNWQAECSLSSPQQVLLSLFLHIHPPLSHLNNKKLFSPACYLTAVLWIDGCVHACAWQLLCTPNEFNHQARCQHVISSLCLLGERWNYSGRNRGGGKEKWKRKAKQECTEGERKRSKEDGWRQAQRALSGCMHVTQRQTRPD